MQKIAVVTGGSKGIGLAIVKKLITENFKVIVAARTIGELDTENKNIIFIETDLTQRKDIENFCNEVKNNTSQIDILVNNAGVFMPGQIHSETEDAFETQMRLNVAAPYHLTRSLLNLMMPFKSGYIFNICSTASIVPYINGGSYCISKHAFLGFSKVLRQEMIAYNIGVSSILPGATLTNSWLGTELPKERFIKPETIANALWFAWQNRENCIMEEILLRPMEGDI